VEAVALAAQRSYDLILMDCLMPEMDGCEAAAAIRRSEPAGQRVPIIAVTANLMEGQREKCLAAGMDDFLPKPIVKQDLERAVRKWLAHANKNPAPPALNGKHQNENAGHC
jgi:CheY-like chemotaxis protein